MFMQSVFSSNISAVGYENGLMVVRFHNYYEYQYSEVPQSLYDTFMLAPSKGQYFNQIFAGRFNETRIA